MQLLRAGVLLAVLATALFTASSARAHAEISPAVVEAKVSQVFALAVPTEKEDAQTSKVELTPPAGFSIERLGEELPLRRIVVPDDVARVVLFCASDLAALMTGSTLLVDAGWLAT